MNIKSGRYIVQEEFDSSVWQKARIQNNSGYLDQQYQITHQFPTLPDYHFRIEDDQTFLQLQKLTLAPSSYQPVKFDQATSKFNEKLNHLLQGLTLADSNIKQGRANIFAETHGFYSLEKNYDDDAAIKQAFNRIQINQVEKQMQCLSIKDKKPQFNKKPLRIKNQTVGPLTNLSRQMNRLTINQEDL